MIKIFHTGDNHLDSAFARLSLSEQERERARQRELFTKMMNYAKEESYDLVLISGDLFDSPTVYPETEQAVIGAFSQLDCPVVISPGNHDFVSGRGPYKKEVFPENVYIFDKEQITFFSFPEINVDVYGYAFISEHYTENPLENQCFTQFPQSFPQPVA